MYELASAKHKGYTLNVYYDENPLAPWEWYDQLPLLVAPYGRRNAFWPASWPADRVDRVSSWQFHDYLYEFVTPPEDRGLSENDVTLRDVPHDVRLLFYDERSGWIDYDYYNPDDEYYSRQASAAVVVEVPNYGDVSENLTLFCDTLKEWSRTAWALIVLEDPEGEVVEALGGIDVEQLGDFLDYVPEELRETVAVLLEKIKDRI